MVVEISEPNLLIVEGKEDVLFFTALTKHLNLENIQIAGIGGKNTLRAELKQIRKSRSFLDLVTSLGIVRDADENPKGAFQSVSSALKAAELPVPKRPLVSVDNTPRVTVMILPDANTSGMLEDVCLKAIENEAAMNCTKQYFECLQQQSLSLPKDISKAKIQVYLAALEAEIRLGVAAQKGFWPWEHPAFDEVKRFLELVVSP